MFPRSHQRRGEMLILGIKNTTCTHIHCSGNTSYTYTYTYYLLLIRSLSGGVMSRHVKAMTFISNFLKSNDFYLKLSQKQRLLSQIFPKAMTFISKARAFILYARALISKTKAFISKARAFISRARAFISKVTKLSQKYELLPQNHIIFKDFVYKAIAMILRKSLWY
jgi:hypothetical protein